MSTLARHDDPIVGIATAPGRGAVGIVRVSGRALSGFVRALLGRDLQPREVHYLAFPDARGEAIDRGLALWFPAPRSYTGEDVLELQAHGGPVVLQLLLARCLEVARLTLPRLRAAQPGEFTEPAFLNDKLDLAQAEAVADLIDASTETAARSAARSLSGEFSAHVHAVRDALVQLRMLVEATLDFPEEEIDFLRKADARGQLSNLQSQVAAVLRQAHQGALLREGTTVVIAGQPNVGKSSLLNALAGAELAIVTPIAGTTRDTVRQTIQIEGMPLHVIDTAGLRDSGDVVERIGIERAWQQIERADAVLFLHDLTRRGEAGCAAADAALGRELAGRLGRAVPLIDVWNKADAAVDAADGAPMQAVVLSALTGQGLQTLRERLLQVVGWQATPEGVFMARERHLQALKAVQAHLLQAAQLLEAPLPALDLMAEELRLAQGALGDIPGEFTADDLLGTIFSRFCIGK